MNWQRVDRDELPPERVEVWTTDGVEVRKGFFAFAEHRKSLDGLWTNENRMPIPVVAWLPLEDSPNATPQPPSG